MQGLQYEDANISTPLTASNFDGTAAHYDVLVVNFFAPWCPWCQRLAPTWEAVTEEIHGRYPESDGRIRLARVDCTAEVELCRKHVITAFPSIRIFRHGSGAPLAAAGGRVCQSGWVAERRGVVMGVGSGIGCLSPPSE